MTTNSRKTKAKNNDTRTAGERLRAARERKGLSQADAAAELGLGAGRLSQLEHNKVMPRIPLAARIQDVFGVPIRAWA